MKRYFSFLMLTAFLSLSFLSFKSSENKIGNMLSKALDNPSGGNYIVWVYFKDKGPNAMSKLNDPLSIVSQRSLDRRLKVKPAGQLLDFTDVPLYSNYVNSVAANVVKVRHQIKWLNCMSVEANREQITAVANYDFVKV